MKSSQILPTARAEKRIVFQDLAGEEEDVGLACPPFDEEDFMAAEASYFDLSEEGFFSRVHEDHKSNLPLRRRLLWRKGSFTKDMIKSQRRKGGNRFKSLACQNCLKLLKRIADLAEVLHPSSRAVLVPTSLLHVAIRSKRTAKTKRLRKWKGTVT